MGKLRWRLWLVVALVGFAVALLPYPGSRPAPAAASTTTRPAAAPQHELPARACGYDSPASAYGSYGSPSASTSRGGY